VSWPVFVVVAVGRCRSFRFKLSPTGRHDAGWGHLLAMIDYKAESAGRTVIAVDPRNTSRTCPDCGHVSARNRHGAVFECQACGHLAHADTNAAINILRAGRAQQRTAAQGRN
jgi:putative transposase